MRKTGNNRHKPSRGTRLVKSCIINIYVIGHGGMYVTYATFHCPIYLLSWQADMVTGLRIEEACYAQVLYMTRLLMRIHTQLFSAGDPD